MKLWVDDVRPAPSKFGYKVVHSVNETKKLIEEIEKCNELVYDGNYETLEWIDIDHDAGNYAFDGGDYIKLLDWLEETGRNYPIRIHSMNPVGRENMRRIIEKNGWKEIC